MADPQQRQAGWAWVRDVVLTLLLPPIGLVFTGSELIRPSLRRRFTRRALITVGILFAIGVLLTIRLVMLLSITTSSVDGFGS